MSVVERRDVYGLNRPGGAQVVPWADLHDSRTAQSRLPPGGAPEGRCPCGARLSEYRRPRSEWLCAPCRSRIPDDVVEPRTAGVRSYRGSRKHPPLDGRLAAW